MYMYVQQKTHYERAFFKKKGELVNAQVFAQRAAQTGAHESDALQRLLVDSVRR